MPKFDGTGPLGYGPRTGRGVGCCGFAPGYARGYGRRFFSRKEEVDMLKEEIGELEKELQAARERLAETEGQK